jgi:hypothetical protein
MVLPGRNVWIFCVAALQDQRHDFLFSLTL